MGPLYLNEADVAGLLSAPELTDALEATFRSLAAQETVQEPRLRVQSGAHVLHNLGAIGQRLGMASLKSYLSGPAGVRFVTLLFELSSSRLAAVLESARLGQLRTGCATALAYRHLVGRPARRLGLVGTGTVAQGQLEALACEARPASIGVWSRRPESRQAFVAWARQSLGLEVEDCATVEAALKGADLVVAATTSATPVVLGSQLGDQGLLCAVGGNWAQRRELDEAAVRRCSRWVVDDRAQAGQEAGDLLLCPDFPWDRLEELAAVVAQGGPPAPSGWVGFKSIGVACEDLAAAHLAYTLACQRGIGQQLRGPG